MANKSNGLQLVHENKYKWIFRDHNNEYVIDWTRANSINQYPTFPKLSPSDIQELLHSSEFFPVINPNISNPFVDAINEIDSTNTIKYLRSTKNITILNVVYEYVFIIECDYTLLKNDDLMLEKYNELIEKYNLLNNKLNELIENNTVFTEKIDVMNTTEINHSNPHSVESHITMNMCTKDDMLKYHKFLIEDIKCSQYINTCKWIEAKNFDHPNSEYMKMYNSDPDLFMFGYNYWFYHFITNHIHDRKTIYDKHVGTQTDDSKLLTYIGIMFSYMSKYNNYDILSFKIRRITIYKENTKNSNTRDYKMTLQFDYKINNKRDYFERYLLDKICEIRNTSNDIELVGSNNYLESENEKYKIVDLFKTKIK